ncbi:glycosyltransferase [Collinsella tanakaei]|uniref:glycosyltransferase n=1 Tax=Collinsella tanakaei TaxID=626935 RepID=UPI0025A4BBED|nr:glycosyltransferase [Collinsella tanakaei]MDM8300426.1 glycosyltransferase [Collinsella tanakaei]
MSNWVVVALVAIVACLIALFCTPLSMKLALKVGAVDAPGGRHIHENPTPRMGGVAIFLGVMIPLCIAFLLMGKQSFGVSNKISLVGLFLSLVVVFVAGCIDDTRQLNPKVKLAFQVIAAIIAAASGALVDDIRSYGGQVVFEMGALSWPATVVYLVAFCNIINLIDGLDGLSAGIVCIASLGLIGVSWQTGNLASALICAGLAGSTLGFLRWNFHPAKTFMGDSGSLFLGFALGLASLVGTMKVSTITSIAVPIIIAGVPVLDTLAAIIRRLRGHVSFDTPDAGHIHHSLLKLGYDQKHVVLTIYAVSSIFAFTGVLIANSGFALRLACVAADFVVALWLVWKLELFEPVLMRLYPQGHGKLFGRPLPGSGQVPQRVLIVCEHFPPALDACAKRMGVMAKELLKRGYDVHVLASETSLDNAKEYSELPSYLHLYPAFRMGKKTVINRLRNNLSEKNGSLRIAATLGRFDVVVVTSPPLLLALSGMTIARKAHARLVFDVRDIWPEVAYQMGSFTEGSIYGKVFRAIADRAYKAASLITTVTPTKVAAIKSLLPTASADKVVLAQNGLDLDFLDLAEREELVAQYELDQDPPCVYIGNLGLAQGLSSLLDMASRFPHIRFLLFGSGAEEQLLRDRIGKKGLTNVCLCGRVDDRGAKTLLRHARCAFVSLKNSDMVDSIPTKLYEALGCGCPVVLAAAGDSVDVLNDCELGFAAAPENLDAIAQAFSDVVSCEWTREERLHSELVVRDRYSRQAAAISFADAIEMLFSETSERVTPHMVEKGMA